jgi:C4-dicarboxylate transporter DctM subunit
MEVAVLFAVFVGGLIVGIPVAITLGLSSLAYMLLAGIPPVVMPQKMYAGMDVFVLLSIPGFILAGNLMNRGGITTASSALPIRWSAGSAAGWA